MGWTAIVPVKRLAHAKTRVADASARAELATAFLDDVLDALAAARTISRVVVVSADPWAIEHVALHGADGLLVSPVDPAAGDELRGGDALNRDLAAGLAHVDGDAVVVVADVPALTAPAVEWACARARAFAPTPTFVGDAQGTGTTMLFAPGGHAEPRFGHHSFAAHASLGFRELTDGASAPATDPMLLARLRRDVDTLVDLWDAQRIGVGPATAQACANHPEHTVQTARRPATVVTGLRTCD